MHQQEKKRLSWVTSCGPNPQVSHTDSFYGVQFFFYGKRGSVACNDRKQSCGKGPASGPLFLNHFWYIVSNHSTV